jgi:hypothetical protein
MLTQRVTLSSIGQLSDPDGTVWRYFGTKIRSARCKHIVFCW